ncbi:hypothetical protein [Sphingobium sp. LSP13-1-1.1]|uniref:hypothetical protein n=1 Tax=Sphingobium sp. LSP13-1-1.1 TaxID=3135234 RepID=UPI00341BD197
MAVTQNDFNDMVMALKDKKTALLAEITSIDQRMTTLVNEAEARAEADLQHVKQMKKIIYNQVNGSESEPVLEASDGAVRVKAGTVIPGWSIINNADISNVTLKAAHDADKAYHEIRNEARRLVGDLIDTFGPLRDK